MGSDYRYDFIPLFTVEQLVEKIVESVQTVQVPRHREEHVTVQIPAGKQVVQGPPVVRFSWITYCMQDEWCVASAVDICHLISEFLVEMQFTIQQYSSIYAYTPQSRRPTTVHNLHRAE